MCPYLYPQLSPSSEKKYPCILSWKYRALTTDMFNLNIFVTPTALLCSECSYMRDKIEVLSTASELSWRKWVGI